MVPETKKNFRTADGQLEVLVLSRRVLLSTMSGRLDLTLARHLLASLEAWALLGGDRLLAFHDWSGVVDYDSAAREHLTPWSRANRSRFDRVHILVQGRVIAWGISIVNALTREVMKVHHDRAAFDELRRQSERLS